MRATDEDKGRLRLINLPFGDHLQSLSMSSPTKKCFRVRLAHTLEKFLQERIKVSGGKAGNLGDSVTVSRDKNKITVVSDSNFSKRCLKYLTKKYLKKHNVRDWLRVIASNKDRNVYELRYFNIAENEGEEED
ncbi:60S ribosomal protein L22-2 [Acorus calamus]|uniref:Large ribosomal subunit protein eL22 n=1 Tax=Acorus calamus TaxID=4465 RepID=A0AAV9CCZ3_ACOCL|nr:60S ribosomal protein L22-2 [Acorus calamus]